MSSAQVRVTRVVYPGWTLGVYGDYSKVSFAQPLLIGNGNYNEEHGGFTVKWQMARKLALTFEYDHYICGLPAECRSTSPSSGCLP